MKKLIALSVVTLLMFSNAHAELSTKEIIYYAVSAGCLVVASNQLQTGWKNLQDAKDETDAGADDLITAETYAGLHDSANSAVYIDLKISHFKNAETINREAYCRGIAGGILLTLSVVTLVKAIGLTTSKKQPVTVTATAGASEIKTAVNYKF